MQNSTIQTRPLVSIIIPVYNVYPYLSESLDSVLVQTYKNLDIIIVDDGSTDGSGKICDIYQKKDSRIRVIHQKNKGLSGARNSGLDVMKGDIVAFLDSDDAFFPDMVEIMVKNMLSSGADIVMGGHYTFDTENHMVMSKANGSYSMNEGIFSSGYILKKVVFQDISIPVWNKVYKRHIFDNLRFNEGRVYEDLLMLPYLVEKANTIQTIEHKLVKHRIRPLSIFYTYSYKNTKDYLYAQKRVIKFVSDRIPAVFYEKHKKQLIDKYFKWLIFYHMRNYHVLRSSSRENEMLIENEIKRFGKRVSKLDLKTRFFYLLYRINPRLCYVFWCSYGVAVRMYILLKRLVKKIL